MSTNQFDGVRTAIIANKVDGIVREMTNTLLRSARSAVINSARDFSCAILTADDELLAAAQAIPVHVFGAQPQAQALREAHQACGRVTPTSTTYPMSATLTPPEPHHLGPGVRRRRAHVHRGHQGSSGRRRQLVAHHVSRGVGIETYEEGALIFRRSR